MSSGGLCMPLTCRCGTPVVQVAEACEKTVYLYMLPKGTDQIM